MKYRASVWLSAGMPVIDGKVYLLETWVVFDRGNYRIAHCSAGAYLHNTVKQLKRANAKAKANAERIAAALNKECK